MRILFASKQHFQVGGVERSTHQLARRLQSRGHSIAAVAGGPLDVPAAGDDGRRFFDVPGLGYSAWGTHVDAPAIALREAKRRFCPDVIVVGAGGRFYHDWTLPLVGACSPTPCALYVRDHGAVELLGEPGFDPDVIFANTAAHAEAVRVAGREAVVVPSLIEPDDYRVTPSGEVVLYINPAPIKGVKTAIMLAASRPDIPFVFLQSWLLPKRVVRELSVMASTLGNVELLEPVSDPRPLYARARVLLAPYEDQNRPRVVAEAQISGIPVLARDDPGLREAVGPGGILVAPGAGLAEWVEALSRLWDEPDQHQGFSAAARAHACRAELDPDAITARVEAALQELVAARERLGSHRGATEASGGRSTAAVEDEQPERRPELVSVVLPVRDGAGTIDQQLAALAVQDYPGPWELVVSDNGCTDDTRAHVLSWVGAFPAEIRIVDSPDVRGVAHARNVGIAASRGEYVLICDADDEVHQGWIRGLVGGLRHHSIVTGAGDRATLNDAHVHEWMGLGPVTTEPEIGYGFLPYASGGNLGIRRNLIEQLGGFDESLRRAEDIDWSWRAHYAGHQVHFVPDAVISYRMRTEILQMALTRFKGGQVEPMLYRRHRVRGMARASNSEVLAEYRWLFRNASRARTDPDFRYSWVAMVAKRAGRLVGSIRHRTRFL